MKTVKLSLALAGFFMLIGNASFAQFNKEDLKKEAAKLETEAKKVIDAEVKKAEDDPEALQAKGEEILEQVQEKRAEKKAAKATEAKPAVESAATNRAADGENAVATEAGTSEENTATGTEGEGSATEETPKEDAPKEEAPKKLSAKERAMNAMKKNEDKTKELTESIGSGDEKVAEGRTKIADAKAKLAEDKAAGNLSDEDEQKRNAAIEAAEAAIDALEEKLKSAKGM